jgi:hypothetical protein
MRLAASQSAPQVPPVLPSTSSVGFFFLLYHLHNNVADPPSQLSAELAELQAVTSKLDTILQASRVPSVLPSADVTAPFSPGFVFNLVPCPPLPHTAHCPPSPGTGPQALVPTADPQQSRRPGGSCTLILSDGTSLVFTEDDVPDPPTTTFTDDIPWLNQMWDDTSTYWNRDLVLKILGHPIPIDHWPEVYKWWKWGNWDVIKSNYVDWKVCEHVPTFLFILPYRPSS